jgi:hypothetical protein
MKIKLGEDIYDSNDIPMVVILSEQDKVNLKLLKDDQYRYAAAPEDAFETQADYKEWVFEGTDREEAYDLD